MINGSTGYTIGVDVGGTFTDVVLNGGQEVFTAKSPTTSRDITRGVLAGLGLVAELTGRDIEEILPEVARFGLGTTAVTNVVASLSGVRVGLITTAGFEDELSLARGIRPSPDGWITTPPEVVQRADVIGVSERRDWNGCVLRPLMPDEVGDQVAMLIDRGVEALAVSFVNAYRDASHEDEAAAIIRDRWPDVPIVTGAQLNPTLGFFSRTAFAVLNAYAMKAFVGIDSLADALAARGLAVPIRLVNAAGGATSAASARRAPMTLLQSGPAAGVAAAATVASRSEITDAIACDMGGTSFDVSVIKGGTPLRRLKADVLGVPTSLSMVDVESIGSGGGSLAWSDSRAMLRVGPRSAGSDPGPACYGRGGTEPTVTDALVVLGYLDPDRFLGGSMRLDLDAAREACNALGERLGVSGTEAAWGIRAIALADMSRAVRLMLNRRGLDARRHTIVSYGGCGGLFTADIAAGLGIPRVIVPQVASVLSAYGAATARVLRERVQSICKDMPVDPATFENARKQLHDAVAQDLREDQVPDEEQLISFEVDLRFKRQNFELSVPVLEDGDSDVMAALSAEFQTQYVARYGEGSILLGTPIEMAAVRAVGQSVVTQESGLGTVLPERRASGALQPVGDRGVVLTGDGEPTQVPVYDGATAVAGGFFTGPACVDRMDTTLWVPRDAHARVDEDGSFIIEWQSEHLATEEM